LLISFTGNAPIVSVADTDASRLLNSILVFTQQTRARYIGAGLWQRMAGLCMLGNQQVVAIDLRLRLYKESEVQKEGHVLKRWEIF
jgi:hypothetical protein